MLFCEFCDGADPCCPYCDEGAAKCVACGTIEDVVPHPEGPEYICTDCLFEEMSDGIGTSY